MPFSILENFGCASQGAYPWAWLSHLHLLQLVADVADELGILLALQSPVSVLPLPVLHMLQAETLGPCLLWTCEQFVWFLPLQCFYACNVCCVVVLGGRVASPQPFLLNCVCSGTSLHTWRFSIILLGANSMEMFLRPLRTIWLQVQWVDAKKFGSFVYVGYYQNRTFNEWGWWCHPSTKKETHKELKEASRSPIVIGLVQLPFVRSIGTRREQSSRSGRLHFSIWFVRSCRIYLPKSWRESQAL